ncbi:MAG: T9SS type A sorting domain-containing protein [Flavobacteriales bacterium]|nr:T9SS type A sorting domain-containing protein [Flavobacteriales bacterium]
MKKFISLFCLGFLSTFTASYAQYTYADVAPIFHQRCSSCHRLGGGAGISLLNYSDISGLASSIDYAVSNDEMPPWSPDTTYTRFFGERIITAQEKQAILDWIAQGAQPGDTTLAEDPPIFSSSPYKIMATPDLEVQMETFASNAYTADVYNCFIIPMNLSQDRILRAIEIVPGNPDIVHHAVLTIDTLGTATTDTSGACYSNQGQVGLGSYVPGAPPVIFPSTGQAKMGIRIPAGSNLSIQMHYPMGSGGELDSTKIRLFFYPQGETGIREVYTSTILQDWNFFIPANDVKEVTTTYDPATDGLGGLDLSVFSAFPHSHEVCTSIVNYAWSGIDTVPLIKIPQWDFEWQGFYTYRELVKIPAGHQFFSSHIYDNTTNNPHNPNNPPAMIFAGAATGEEMLFDAFQFLVYMPGDENINIDSLLLNDPLVLSTGIDAVDSYSISQSFVFPNPVNNEINISFRSSFAKKYSLQVFDISGKEVLRQNGMMTGSVHTHTIANAENLNIGTYLYTIRFEESDTLASGKFVKK